MLSDLLKWEDKVLNYLGKIAFLEIIRRVSTTSIYWKALEWIGYNIEKTDIII